MADRALVVENECLQFAIQQQSKEINRLLWSHSKMIAVVRVHLSNVAYLKQDGKFKSTKDAMMAKRFLNQLECHFDQFRIETSLASPSKLALLLEHVHEHT